MADKSKKNDKPSPKRCVCGAEAVVVRTRHGKMISCPNPEKCKANIRTRWHSQVVSAINEWNLLVESQHNKG